VESFEIKEEDINVEEIMRKIRDNMDRRKDGNENSDVENVIGRGSDGKQEIPKTGDPLQKELDYINSNWDIQNNNYIISSHRRATGKALVKGREAIHGEVRRYVDPMISKQKDFNRSIATILKEASKSMSEVKVSIDQLLAQMRSTDQLLALIDEKIARVQAKISPEIEDQVRAVFGAMNEDIENRAWLAEILDKRIAKSIEVSSESSDNADNELNYFVFEERFRGSRTDIKGRQLLFIKFFEGCKNVLDIGCGRGEFLEILMERGIGSRGIDTDEDMVKFCASKGFDVDRIDAVSYLEKLEDKSLDGIFIDQVVEHLEPEYLIRMLGLCYKKLIYGGSIVAETVNPLSFFSFANFYIDMSHKRPIHPETLKFLLKAVGFRDIEIKLLSPVRNEARLKKIDDSSIKDGNCEANNLFNYNIDMLNNILFGPQDYALIGKK